MGPLLLGALIGGGVGGLKHFLVDKPQADKERQYQAETARWSPWTGLQSKYVRDPSLFGNMLQGGMGGAAFGQLAGMGGAANASPFAVAPEISSPAAAYGVGGIGPFANPDLYENSLSTYAKMLGR